MPFGVDPNLSIEVGASRMKLCVNWAQILELELKFPLSRGVLLAKISKEVGPDLYT